MKQRLVNDVEVGLREFRDKLMFFGIQERVWERLCRLQFRTLR